MTMNPLFHITLPPLGDNSPESHFAPLVFALEGLIAINKFHIERSLRRAVAGMGPPIPPLYESGVRYKEDEAGREDWRDVLVILQRGFGDCLPISTLAMREDREMTTLGELKPGDRIMGLDGFVNVLEHAVTGKKEILAFELSNGCTLRCSPDHRLFRDIDGMIEEVFARDVRVRDDLLTPSSIPISSEDGIDWPASLMRLNEDDRAWLLGVFVADGWVDGECCRASISGLDGDIKEAQKRRVETLMISIGVRTRWHRKYVSINDREIAEFFAMCGHRATNKRLPSVMLQSETVVRNVLAGLAADAGRSETGNEESSLIYGTTSPSLALQLRILHRMLGKSVSIRRTDDHGGLGKNPIYRVIPREKIKPGTAERRDKKFARVRSISDDGIDMCCDITVEGGKFWLPESDVIVHNCDNLIGWRVAELRVAGVAADPVIKWQHLTREIAIKLGYPARMLSPDGLWLVHCCVRYPDGSIEDPSKILGMGGNYTNGV
jgi:hypothetical protein